MTHDDYIWACGAGSDLGTVLRCELVTLPGHSVEMWVSLPGHSVEMWVNLPGHSAGTWRQPPVAWGWAETGRPGESQHVWSPWTWDEAWYLKHSQITTIFTTSEPLPVVRAYIYECAWSLQELNLYNPGMANANALTYWDAQDECQSQQCYLDYLLTPKMLEMCPSLHLSHDALFQAQSCVTV